MWPYRRRVLYQRSMQENADLLYSIEFRSIGNPKSATFVSALGAVVFSSMQLDRFL